MLKENDEAPNAWGWITKFAICAVGAVAIAGTALASPAGASPTCSKNIAIGVPGSNQGFRDNAAGKGGAANAEDLFGKEVMTSLFSLVKSVGDVSLRVVDYPAKLDGPNAKVAYPVSVYKNSKDKGYAEMRKLLAAEAANCPGSQFFLVGYSQGAHIAGDLAQSVFHGEGPVPKSRIGGVVLLADPAFNSDSPGTNEYVYEKDSITDHSGQWKIHGALGTRAAFDKNDPVISVCIYGDPICDSNSAGWGGYNPFGASSKAWMHALYAKDNSFGVGNSLASWAGKSIEGK